MEVRPSDRRFLPSSPSILRNPRRQVGGSVSSHSTSRFTQSTTYTPCPEHTMRPELPRPSSPSSPLSLSQGSAAASSTTWALGPCHSHAWNALHMTGSSVPSNLTTSSQGLSKYPVSKMAAHRSPSPRLGSHTSTLRTWMSPVLPSLCSPHSSHSCLPAPLKHTALPQA